MTPITCTADLKALPNWVVFAFKPQPAGKKPRKVPYTPGTNRKALVNDSTTWRTYAEAETDSKRTGRHPGFAITPDLNLTLIDRDGRVDDELIKTLDSLSETSINDGTHIIVRGRPPENFVAPPGIEVYPRDGNRFVLITERFIDGRDVIHDRTDLLAELFPPAAPAAPLPSTPLTLDDDELLALAFAAVNGTELKQLLAGDLNGHGNDHSAADLAAASKLAFWTQDAAQIARIIGASPLGNRGKWQERPDYQARTIAKALSRSSFYTPPGAPITRPKIASRTPVPTGDPCAHRIAELEAENAALRQSLAERDATVVALTQTILNPHLTHTEKVAAISIARHADAKRSGGHVESDGRIVLSPSEVADDWRPKPEPGEHIAPVNPDSGTAPHMPRSSARSVLDTAIERELIQGEKRGTVRRRADGSTYKDWEYVVSPAASFADLLNPWATWRPDQPKVRKVRESRACRHCGEVHAITRVDYCGGCGGELSRQTIEQTNAGENISPIRSVVERDGRKTFSRGTLATEPHSVASPASEGEIFSPVTAEPSPSQIPILKPNSRTLTAPGSGPPFGTAGFDRWTH